VTEFHRLPGEADTLAFGRDLARRLVAGDVVYLYGDLGAGKTTLVRGLLRGLGFDGRVKSPSYGLVETYELPHLTVHHLDLYRLGRIEEVDFMGIEDWCAEQTVLLVEWPERGGRLLPPASLSIKLKDAPEGGRELRLSAGEEKTPGVTKSPGRSA